MKKVLVVGGSSGFGSILAKALSTDYLVTATGRRNFSFPNISCISLDSDCIDAEWLSNVGPQIIVNNGYDKGNHIPSFANSLAVIRESIKYFKKTGGGTIVNVNSIAGLNPDTKDPDYAASKHGLKGYVDSVSYDAYQNNIRIIGLYPRAIATGMSLGRSDFANLIDPEELAIFCTSLLATQSFYVSTIVFDRTCPSPK
jgi:NAD(P)-dependent dehydrogenase (short-subunit alcohol dehydrogenase family)